MAEAFYRLQSAGGDWTRVTGTVPITNYASTHGAIATVAATVTINGAAEALADTVAAGDTVSVVIMVADDAGNSRAFLAGSQAVAGVAPGITASASTSSRLLTISVDGLTGAPAPATALTVLTLDGADVLADATGSGPWDYAVPDSTAAQTVAWTVEASNTEGTATASGSAAVAPNLNAVSVATTGGVGEIVFDPIASLDAWNATTGNAGEIILEAA